MADRIIYTCVGASPASFYFPEFLLTSGPTVPAWIDYFGAMDVFGVTIEIDNPPAAGTFTYDFGSFTVDIVVSADCYSLYDPCCNPDKFFNISWVNIYGGRQNYLFDGFFTLEGRQEGGEQLFERDFVLKYSDTGNIYDGVICSVRDIPYSHVAKIWSLKNAPQAWLWNSTSHRFDIPIIIDRESITKRRSRDKFFNVSLRFCYAERLRIQTQ